MIQFEYNEKQYNLQDDWRELTFGQYLKIIEMIDTSRLIPIPEIIINLDLIGVLTNTDGELDDIPYTLHIQLAPYVEAIIKDLPKFNETKNLKIKTDHFDLNGTIYSYNKGDFQAAEIADIAEYAKQYGNDQEDIKLVLKCAAVIIRKATEQQTESGTKYWKLVRRDPKDQDAQEYAIKQMNCLWVSSVVNFFFAGKKNLKKDTSNFSLRKL